MKAQSVSRSGSGRRRLVALTVTAIMLAGVAPLSSPGSARAAVLGAPTLVTPASGATVTGNPVFAWTVVSGAAKYRIQISSSPSFTSPVAADTQNLRFAPPTELPLGTLYWRVAALDPKNVLGTYATGIFEKGWGASPEPISPPLTDPGDPEGVMSLEFPTDPLLFTWHALPGAQSYQLQVDDADDFIGATTYTTKNTAFVITEPRTVDQTFFWHLRGVSGGNYSDWSATGKFRSTWAIKPVLVYPANNAVNVTDVYFDWDPVLGAKSYQLQVSPNGDWANNITIDITVKSTRDDPPVPLNNGNYFWRVRARDAASTANFGPWSDNEGISGDERVFQRGWPDMPSLLWPANGTSTSVQDPADTTWQNPTFSWTPARHASWYRFRFATDPAMSTALQGCITNRTTWTPYNNGNSPLSGISVTNPGSCAVALTPGTTYYWDVAGIDNPVLNAGVDIWGPPSTSGVIGLRSSVRSFVYDPPSPPAGAVRPLDPADYLTPARCNPGDACDPEADTPVFTWTAIPAATSYTVTVALDPNFTNVYRVYSTPFNRLAPRDSWRDNQANQAYYWVVTPNGVPLDISQPAVFQKRTEGIHRTAPAASAERPNDFTFEWRDYLDTNQSLTPRIPQEAKQYRIQVSTVSDFATTIDTSVGNTPFYTPSNKTYPEGPIYWRVQAIDGSNNDLTVSQVGGGLVTKKSPAPTQSYPANGATVKGVPYLQWLPLAYAASYDVQIDNDANFSSPVATATATKMTAWAYAEPLAAGVYYWRVRRNDADTRDGAWSSVRSFDLKPSAPTLVNPTNGSSPSQATLLLQWTATQAAPKYQVEVSISSVFSSYVSGYPQATVMTSWAPKTILANGTYYWRVKALNASGTAVATSSVFNFKIGERTPFTDIAGSKFFWDIIWLYESGITKGCTATRFCPLNTVTRGQMAAFLDRALGLPPTTKDYFRDDETSKFEASINRLAAAGITKGCTATKFCPLNTVTRGQMAAFLDRALALPPTTTDYFSDDETSKFEASINRLAASGITRGCTATKFCPLNTVTRGQMAAFLHRALK
jgi:hypothetical protein